MLAIGDAWNPDRVIVLTSNTDTVEKHIRQRNRPHESAENMVRRFKLIDAEFRRLAPQYPNTVVINRDNMEFHAREGLKADHRGGRPADVPRGAVRGDESLRREDMTRYWLMKCEPGAYTIDDLKRDGRTSWEGVRNYQARNFMRDDMQVGDGVLFYASNADPSGVTGLATIVERLSRAEQAKPIWHMVDIGSSSASRHRRRSDG